MYIYFDGIKRLRSVGGGCIKAIWNPAISNYILDSYNVYIRADDPDVFNYNYLWANVRNDVNEVIIRTEANRDEFLRNHICYYIGVNAVDEFGYIDDNLYVKNMSVYGDGSESVEVPDRKIAKVV